MHPTETPCVRTVAHGPHHWRETGGRRRTYACPGKPAGPAQPRAVRLRRGALTPAALAGYGWPSPRAAGIAMGIAPSTLRRVIAGDIAPGERVIAALLHGTGHTFEAIFEVCRAR